MGRKRKHRGKWDRINLPPGRVIHFEGGRTFTVYSTRSDEAGHLIVCGVWECNPRRPGPDEFCTVCHGKPVEHRFDKIKAGRIKSCGRLKKKLRSEYLRRRTEHPLLDVHGDPIPADARLKRGPRL